MRYLLATVLLTALLTAPAGALTRDQNWALCESGDPELSIAACTALIEGGSESRVNMAIAYSNRGITYSDNGDFDRAIADYEHALEFDPDMTAAMNSLAWDLATMPSAGRRDGRRAVELAEKVLAADQNEPGFLDTAAAAYAEAGRFADAVETQQRAIDLLEQAGDVPADIIEDFDSRLQLYRNNRPFHRTP